MYKILSSPTIRLTLSQLISLGFSFISSVIIANSLGVEKFGIFTFYFSIIYIFLLFFRFGYFSSTGVLIVQTNNKKRQSELIGAGFVLSILIGIGYGLFLFLISKYIDEIFKSNIKEYIVGTLPFLVFLPLTMYINQVSQSLNNYKPLIIYNVSSAFISFVIVLLLYYFHLITIEYFIFSKVIPMSIIILVIFMFFKMNFSNLFKNLAIINLKNKKHGFHLYLGQISDQFVYKSDELMINYFAGSSELGLYKIAQQLTNPFGMLAKNYAFSKFKVVAKASFIDNLLQKKLVLISIFSMIVSIIFSYITINYFYISDYKFAFFVAIILSVAIFFNSIYQLHNNFLNAHSLGKVTKINSIKMSIVNIVGNFLFIPFFGSVGAAVASTMSMFTYGFFTLKEYNKIKIRGIK